MAMMNSTSARRARHKTNWKVAGNINQPVFGKLGSSAAKTKYGNVRTRKGGRSSTS